MTKPCGLRLTAVTLLLFIRSALFCTADESDLFCSYTDCQDTLFLKQLIFNGRIWKNNYLNFDGHPYLFSDKFLRGSVTVAGKCFDNLPLMYDIFKDEILTTTGDNLIIQLNKEMVQAFTIDYENRTYRFIRVENNRWKNLSGYVNVLYEGELSVFKVYKKLTEPPSVGSNKNRIYQIQRIYLIKDDLPYQVRNKKQILMLLKDKKEELRDFIKKEKLRLSVKIPDSIVQVSEYYESLK